MTKALINKLSNSGIDFHHKTETYIAFKLNGWKYVQIPIHHTKKFQSIINYLNY